MTLSGLIPTLLGWWILIGVIVAIRFWSQTGNERAAMIRGAAWPILLVRYLIGRQREHERAGSPEMRGAAGGSSLPALSGRHLSSSLSLDECEEMFRQLAHELGGYNTFVRTRWSGSSADAPHLLLMATSHGQPALHLAVRDVGGRREIDLVPAHDPEQLPPAMIGQWKMRDSSLSSIGTVQNFSVSS
jgi:hypothetical protein